MPKQTSRAKRRPPCRELQSSGFDSERKICSRTQELGFTELYSTRVPGGGQAMKHDHDDF